MIDIKTSLTAVQMTYLEMPFREPAYSESILPCGLIVKNYFGIYETKVRVSCVALHYFCISETSATFFPIF